MHLHQLLHPHNSHLSHGEIKLQRYQWVDIEPYLPDFLGDAIDVFKLLKLLMLGKQCQNLTESYFATVFTTLYTTQCDIIAANLYKTQYFLHLLSFTGSCGGDPDAIRAFYDTVVLQSHFESPTFKHWLLITVTTNINKTTFLRHNISTSSAAINTYSITGHSIFDLNALYYSYYEFCYNCGLFFDAMAILLLVYENMTAYYNSLLIDDIVIPTVRLQDKKIHILQTTSTSALSTDAPSSWSDDKQTLELPLVNCNDSDPNITQLKRVIVFIDLILTKILDLRLVFDVYYSLTFENTYYLLNLLNQKSELDLVNQDTRFDGMPITVRGGLDEILPLLTFDVSTIATSTQSSMSSSPYHDSSLVFSINNAISLSSPMVDKNFTFIPILSSDGEPIFIPQSTKLLAQLLSFGHTYIAYTYNHTQHSITLSSMTNISSILSVQDQITLLTLAKNLLTNQFLHTSTLSYCLSLLSLNNTTYGCNLNNLTFNLISTTVNAINNPIDPHKEQILRAKPSHTHNSSIYNHITTLLPVVDILGENDLSTEYRSNLIIPRILRLNEGKLKKLTILDQFSLATDILTSQFRYPCKIAAIDDNLVHLRKKALERAQKEALDAEIAKTNKANNIASMDDETGTPRPTNRAGGYDANNISIQVDTDDTKDLSNTRTLSFSPDPRDPRENPTLKMALKKSQKSDQDAIGPVHLPPKLSESQIPMTNDLVELIQQSITLPIPLPRDLLLTNAIYLTIAFITTHKLHFNMLSDSTYHYNNNNTFSTLINSQLNKILSNNEAIDQKIPHTNDHDDVSMIRCDNYNYTANITPLEALCYAPRITFDMFSEYYQFNPYNLPQTHHRFAQTATSSQSNNMLPGFEYNPASTVISTLFMLFQTSPTLYHHDMHPKMHDHIEFHRCTTPQQKYLMQLMNIVLPTYSNQRLQRSNISASSYSNEQKRTIVLYKSLFASVKGQNASNHDISLNMVTVHDIAYLLAVSVTSGSLHLNQINQFAHIFQQHTMNIDNQHTSRIITAILSSDKDYGSNSSSNRSNNEKNNEVLSLFGNTNGNQNTLLGSFKHQLAMLKTTHQFPIITTQLPLFSVWLNDISTILYYYRYCLDGFDDFSQFGVPGDSMIKMLENIQQTSAKHNGEVTLLLLNRHQNLSYRIWQVEYLRQHDIVVPLEALMLSPSQTQQKGYISPHLSIKSDMKKIFRNKIVANIPYHYNKSILMYLYEYAGTIQQYPYLVQYFDAFTNININNNDHVARGKKILNFLLIHLYGSMSPYFNTININKLSNPSPDQQQLSHSDALLKSQDTTIVTNNKNNKFVNINNIIKSMVYALVLNNVKKYTKLRFITLFHIITFYHFFDLTNDKSGSNKLIITIFKNIAVYIYARLIRNRYFLAKLEYAPPPQPATNQNTHVLDRYNIINSSNPSKNLNSLQEYTAISLYNHTELQARVNLQRAAIAFITQFDIQHAISVQKRATEELFTAINTKKLESPLQLQSGFSSAQTALSLKKSNNVDSKADDILQPPNSPQHPKTPQQDPLLPDTLNLATFLHPLAVTAFVDEDGPGDAATDLQRQEKASYYSSVAAAKKQLKNINDVPSMRSVVDPASMDDKTVMSQSPQAKQEQKLQQQTQLSQPPFLPDPQLYAEITTTFNNLLSSHIKHASLLFDSSYMPQQLSTETKISTNNSLTVDFTYTSTFNEPYTQLEYNRYFHFSPPQLESTFNDSALSTTTATNEVGITHITHEIPPTTPSENIDVTKNLAKHHLSHFDRVLTVIHDLHEYINTIFVVELNQSSLLPLQLDFITKQLNPSLLLILHVLVDPNLQNYHFHEANSLTGVLNIQKKAMKQHEEQFLAQLVQQFVFEHNLNITQSNYQNTHISEICTAQLSQLYHHYATRDVARCFRSFEYFLIHTIANIVAHSGNKYTIGSPTRIMAKIMANFVQMDDEDICSLNTQLYHQLGIDTTRLP